ncbi:MAG: methionine adenosyltransferase [Elusimicrobiota bacterium]
MKDKTYTFTSESVTEGHPDKVSDQISDGLLDEILKYDNKQGLTPYKLDENSARGSRVACETFVSTGLVLVGGEITTGAYIDVKEIIRDIVKDIGYTDPSLGFEHKSLCILNAINEQSPDIAQGVDSGGAGDQGLMIGYATDETEELMPVPVDLSHKLAMKLAEVRKEGILKFLKPDGKSQVTVSYEDGVAKDVDAVVIAAQHDESVVDSSGNISAGAKEKIVKHVIKPVIPGDLLSPDTEFLINPTGRFVVGGPQSDTGMTGRKIIVDTYGGLASHGGGAFSGKDPTKVDRSASYAARYVAKNVVAAGLAKRCTVHIAYAIGVTQPLNVMIHTEGTSVIPDEQIEKIIMEKNVFDLTPVGIIDMLDLWKPRYKETAAYGHFGRAQFPWEKTDKARLLKQEAGKLGA